MLWLASLGWRLGLELLMVVVADYYDSPSASCRPSDRSSVDIGAFMALFRKF